MFLMRSINSFCNWSVSQKLFGFFYLKGHGTFPKKTFVFFDTLNERNRVDVYFTRISFYFKDSLKSSVGTWHKKSQEGLYGWRKDQY